MSQKVSDMSVIPTLAEDTKIPTGAIEQNVGNYATNPRQIEQLINACSVSDDTSDTLSATSGTHIFNGDDDATWAFPTPSAGNPIKVIKNKTAEKSLTIQGPESNKLWTFQQVSSVVIGPGESATFQWDGTHWTTIR